MQRVLDNPDPHFGYNAATGNYENLMESGIIDPTKVRLGFWTEWAHVRPELLVS